MTEWQTVHIEEIAEKIAMGPFGSNIKVDTFVPTGIPIISGQHLHGTRVDDGAGFNFITDEHANRLANANVQRGDIVLTHRGNIGQAAYIPRDSEFDRYVISQSQFYVRCDRSRALPEFVATYFKSPIGQHQLLANSSQVGVPSIAQPVTYLRTIEIRLPPLPEQRAIADILGTLDDKIELSRRMNETLEAMARAIFKDWFVEFGPTRAKAEGRTPYLATELWDLFPDVLDDGKPLGWELSEIGREVEAVGGATPSTKESSYWKGGENHWATPKDLSKLASPVLLDTDRKITDAAVNKISSGLLPVGTVLLSSRAPIGYLAIAEVPTAVNQGFIAMVCRKRLPNLFVLFWSYENLDFIKGISGGSTFAEISKKAFRPVPVIVPSVQILAAYESLIRPFYERIVANTKEASSLAQTRDLLLPKLISGEIRLAEAEKMSVESS
ncbi:MAG: restriction endonuclease subunit S [bacterium]|nr:restriction endonuclease subunit S [bacterium]